MSSGKQDDELGLDEQRFLLAIRSSQEEDEHGLQQADFTQLRDWLGWSSNKLDYRFEQLEERGLITVSYRSEEEIDTNRHPPRLATLTETAIQLSNDGGLKDAMFEQVRETADPRTYDEIFDRLDAVETLVEEYQRESIDHYKKWSQVLTELRENASADASAISDLRSRVEDCSRQISLLLGTVYTDEGGTRDYTGVNETLDQIIKRLNQIGDIESSHQERVHRVEGRIESRKSEAAVLDTRVTTIEEYLQSEGHRMRPARFEPADGE
jgi:hypothetical protein